MQHMDTRILDGLVTDRIWFMQDIGLLHAPRGIEQCGEVATLLAELLGEEPEGFGRRSNGILFYRADIGFRVARCAQLRLRDVSLAAELPDEYSDLLCFFISCHCSH